MSWAMVAIGAGTALSAGGGMLSGQAANRGARQQRDYAAAGAARNMYGLNSAFYGQRRGLEETLGRLDPGIRERFVSERFGLADTGSGQNFSAMPPEQLAALIQQRGGVGGGSGLLGQYQSLQGQARQDQGRIGGMYRQQTGSLMGLARGAEDMAAQYGAGGERLIREQSELDRKGADARSRVALSSMGLGGSTFLGNQLSGNARDFGRSRDQQILGLRQSALDRQLGARSQTIGMLGQRFAGSSNMAQGFQQQNLGLAQLPLNLQMQILTGGTMNPASQFNPGGQSPGGNAMVSGGNALAGIGGFGLMNGGFGGGGQGGGLNMGLNQMRPPGQAWQYGFWT